MKTFTLNRLRNSSVWQLFRMKDRIEMNPVYQRESDIWGEDAQKQLIDTVLNQFDVPKLYLHKYPAPVTKEDRVYEYAVIDGKQRLTALWKYIEGAFSLADQFEYLRDPSINAGQFTYGDLAREYPEIKTDFDSYPLDVVTIETDEIELIEEMFSRLNEAMPLNAAEKRNALPGPLPDAVRSLSEQPFFKKKLPFDNSRYRHFDLIAKMLLAASKNQITDTKKAYLDRFFRDSVTLKAEETQPMVEDVRTTLVEMAGIFTDSDPLLRSIGMVMLYFHLFRRARPTEHSSLITRTALLAFDEKRRENRTIAETDISNADYDLLEFDRLTQSPNDALALRFRLAVIDDKVFGGKLKFERPA